MIKDFVATDSEVLDPKLTDQVELMNVYKRFVKNYTTIYEWKTPSSIVSRDGQFETFDNI